ncbi:TIGR02594 family protein (plasmid) [Cupriavidus pinatubonensis]|uniref:NlpC/P60 family protein n=1 Tax=Cupriavidus pinatubonensis TaxID=248026 RepID=UPI001C73CD75|nr:TIGR02594 family protein [Cupriavidus pinatubonensis]QYY33781.1 TIGR02594 family protein [Cupriavidus pinatubonensis]
MNTRKIQETLLATGFDPGPIDGVRGRQTIAAVKSFQKVNGLTVDGIVGPKTAMALFHDAPPAPKKFDVPDSLPWLQTAFDLIGTRQKPGHGSNEAIIGWTTPLGILNYNDDDIPWCGLFVAHCIGSQLPEEALPNAPLLARAWRKFGREITAQLGAVMVFWRNSPTGTLGHVGFYWAEDDEAFHILGGNQSDAVSVTRIAKQRLICARWPSTGLKPMSVSRFANNHGELLSTNEA